MSEPAASEKYIYQPINYIQSRIQKISFLSLRAGIYFFALIDLASLPPT